MSKEWITNNLWLKIISLMLAVIAWLYISGELTKREGSLYPRAPFVPKP